MKRFYLIIFSILSVFTFSINISQAISVANFTPALDKKVAKLETTEEKVKFLQTFAGLLANPKFTQDKNSRLFEDLREYTLNMLNVFQHQLKQENSVSSPSSSKNSSSNTNSSSNSTTKSTINLPRLTDNFSNIDEQKVRDTVLSRHNDERNSIGVNAYIYNLDLEGSATTWANKLADSGKTSNLHLRNSGDGTYSYNSILNRFSDLGIEFPVSVGSAASFSESIGYGYYKCSKSDCTQELINAIKTTWTGLIMKEKSYNGSHYRAATMKHFTQMGVGIAIDKSHNRYYVVLHYGVDF